MAARRGRPASRLFGPTGEELAHESGHGLVDHLDMTPDRMLDLVGLPGGPLADATLWHLEVMEAGALTPTLYRVVLTAPGLEGLRYMPGQDLMFRVPRDGDRVVNRRYTIRAFDAMRAAVIIDVSLHGAGPGTDWIRGARIGDQIEAIGPRGKITLREDADWHLFVGDETASARGPRHDGSPSLGLLRHGLARDRHSGRRTAAELARNATIGAPLASPFGSLGAR